MSNTVETALDHPEVQLARKSGYITGFVLASVLMGIAFLISNSKTLPSTEIDILIALIAFSAIAIQSYFLFHLNLSDTQRWHTAAFILTIPLFVLLVGLSIWLFHTLALRTTIPGLH